jgi:small subunit ribosomal protein S16
MVVKIRLSRYGRAHAPYYRIMIADSRRARDGKHIEQVGAYDPLVKNGVKHLRLNTERIRHWLAVGAQPSDTVARLLEKAKYVQLFDFEETFFGSP